MTHHQLFLLIVGIYLLIAILLYSPIKREIKKRILCDDCWTVSCAITCAMFSLLWFVFYGFLFTDWVDKQEIWNKPSKI